MKNWPLKPLGELCDVEGGNAAPQSEEDFENGTVPFVRMKDLGRYHFTNNLSNTSDKLTENAIGKYRMKMFEPGCILFPRSGSVALNHRAILGIRAGIVSHIGVLQNFEPTISASFLYRYLTTFDMTALSKKTTGVDSIAFSDVKKIPIPVPPLPEQTRIVKLLDEADALRKLRAQADTRTAELIPALFDEMFGNPETNPKGLTKLPLGEVLRVKSGEGLSAKNMGLGGTFPVYGGNGVNGYHTKYMLEKPVVVIGRVGALCGAVHLSEPKSWITDNALYVCELKQEVELEYLLHALRIANFNQYAGRVAQPLISGNRIYPIPILVPPLPLQKEFAARVAAIRELGSQQSASRTRLEALFQSMLHKAFRGEL